MKQTRLWMFAAILTLLCGTSAMHNYCLGNKKYKNRLHLRITSQKNSRHPAGVLVKTAHTPYTRSWLSL